jgi:hypothetical protein
VAEDFALEEVNELLSFNRSYYVGIYRRAVEIESHFISCFGFLIIMIFMEKERVTFCPLIIGQVLSSEKELVD